MGTGYTRNDTSNNIADGNIINAADLDGEFDAIESAMGTSGHTHDGTSAEGGPVTVLGPVQDFVASATEIKPKTTNTLDIGTSGLLFKDMFLDGVATMGSIKIDNAGTIGSASDGDAIAISSGGVVSFSQNTIGKTGSGYVLALQTSDTTIEATNVLGKIEFSAPDEASGTDAILVGASIEALAEATFDSATNSTALVFKTNTTGAATERMRLTSAGDLHFLDDRKAIFGAGSDLQIYHNTAGFTGNIIESATNNLYIRSNSLYFQKADGTENNMFAISDGAVSLAYDNAVKLATTSTGVDVTGTLTSDGLTVDGDARFTGTLSTLNYPNSLLLDYFSTVTGTRMFSIGPDASTEGQFEFHTATTSANKKRLSIASGGDISFYEDTGTTAKFFWDAAAESLQLGSTTSDESSLFAYKNDATYPGITVRQDGSAPIQKWLGASGVERMTIDSSGNVNLTGLSNGTLNFAGGNTSGGSKIQAWNDAGNANGYLAIEGYSSEYMRIDSSGNVGIGTTSPSKKLHISGDRDAILRFENTRTVESGDQILGSLEFYSNDESGTGANVRSRINAFTAGGGNLSYLTFSTADGTTDDVEAMRIDSSGNLLVGNTATVDSARLLVTGGGITHQHRQFNARPGSGVQYEWVNRIGAGFDFYVNNASILAARIDSSGNLLVGKTETGYNTSAGTELWSNGFTAFTRDDAVVSYFNRKTSDGSIVQFLKDGTLVGSIGVDNTDNLTISGNSGHCGLNFSTDDVNPYKNGAYTNGTTNLGSNTTRFKDLYLSGGVYLGGTGADNKLDDYEEGTWTPTYSFDGGGTVTVTANTGLYVKIGDLVHCAFKIRSTGVSGVSGNLYINGFPYTAVSDSRSAGSKWFARNWGSDMPNFSFGIPGSQTYAALYKQAMNSGTSTVTTADFSTGSDNNVLEASITYRVA